MITPPSLTARSLSNPATISNKPAKLRNTVAIEEHSVVTPNFAALGLATNWRDCPADLSAQHHRPRASKPKSFVLRCSYVLEMDDNTRSDASELTLFDPDEFGDEIGDDPERADRVFAQLAVARSGAEGLSPLRIERVRLRNVLGFADATVYPQPFSILVGSNNSGKSSLMRAIGFAQTLMRVHVERLDDQRVVLARGRNLDDSILPVPDVRDLWYRGLRREGNVWVMAEIQLEFENGLAIGFGMKGPFGHATSRLLDGSPRELPRTDFDRLVNFPIVYVPSSVGVVDHEEYRTPARIGSLIAGGRAHEVLRNLLYDLKVDNRLNEVSDLLESYFSGSIAGVSFDRDSDAYIQVSYSEDSTHDLFGTGAGFLQVLQLLTFLAHERPGILLVDEPDAHLHSSLQRLVIDVLRKASSDLAMQVILATHSKEIVSYVDPSELLVVDRKRSDLRGLGQHENAISVLETLGAVDSVDAYQVITNKRVLLVEGSSDRKLLSAFASQLGSHVFEGTDRLVIVETGGESTGTAKSDLEILERILDSAVSSFQILDRDARLDDARVRLLESSTRPRHMWIRDSIESYLIVPGAIARIVSKKRADVDLGHATTFVEGAISAVISELSDATFDRVSNKYRHEVIASESRNVEVSEANNAAREVLTDQSALFNLTRGKDLLAGVRAKVSEEYNVTFGNLALVAEIQPAEIPEELAEVLRQIESLGSVNI